LICTQLYLHTYLVVILTYQLINSITFFNYVTQCLLRWGKQNPFLYSVIYTTREEAMELFMHIDKPYPVELLKGMKTLCINAIIETIP